MPRIRKLREARHSHAGRDGDGEALNTNDPRKKVRDTCIFYDMCKDDAAFENRSVVSGKECPAGRWYAPKESGAAK